LIPIQDIERLVLATSHDQVRDRTAGGQVRKNRRAPGGEITVSLEESQLIRGREVLGNGEIARELEQRIAIVVVRRGSTVGVECPVAGQHVQIIVRIYGGGASAHPDAAFAFVRRRVEDRGLRERRAVV